MMSEQVDSLRETVFNLGMLCEWLLDVIKSDALTVELLESILDDLEIGDYSLYSAVTNCLEPVGY
jgi:hypothetical protein